MQTNTDWLLEYIDHVDDFAAVELLANPQLPTLLEANFSLVDIFNILTEDIAWNLNTVIPQGPKTKGNQAKLIKQQQYRSSLNQGPSPDQYASHLNRMVKKVAQDPTGLKREKAVVKATQAVASSGRGASGKFVNKAQYQSKAHDIVAKRLSQKFGRDISVDQVRDLAKATNALKARGVDPAQAAKIAMRNLKTRGNQLMRPSQLSGQLKPSQPRTEPRVGMTPAPQKKPSIFSRALSYFSGKGADSSYKSVPIQGTLGVKGGPSYTVKPNPPAPSSPIVSRPAGPEQQVRRPGYVPVGDVRRSRVSGPMGAVRRPFTRPR